MDSAMDDVQATTALLKALSHSARFEIASLLRHGEVCVCHLEAHLGYRQPYISQQIMVLKKAHLVAERREGTYVYYRLADRRVAALLDALSPRATVPRSRARRVRDCSCPKCTPLKARR
jgi:ArsR family transcriptional regulator, arsenate/arsenite/antimonite-responsive transcriptional repressor